MREYFVVMNSFGYPFSDTEEKFIKGNTQLKAMELAVKEYAHPCKLYAADLYASSDDYHKGKKRLANYLSNLVLEQERLTKNKSGYSLLHDTDGGGEFIEIDGRRTYVEKPREGKCFIN